MKTEKKKKIFLVRHAHRAFSPEQDPPLTSRGHQQATRLKEYFLDELQLSEFYLASSPKKRCLQTVDPLVDYLKARRQEESFFILDSLDQGATSEKIAHFLKWLDHHSPNILIVCSHADWLPDFVEKTANQTASFEKGQVLEMDWFFSEQCKSIQTQPLGSFFGAALI